MPSKHAPSESIIRLLKRKKIEKSTLDWRSLERLLADVGAGQALGHAAGDLYAAAYLLGSITKIALRGGASLPCNPLPNIRRIPRTAAPQRNASLKLREARLFATEAYDAVELCCDYLVGVRLLLDHPLLPSVDNLIDDDRLNAYDLLEKVREITDDCAKLAVATREDVSV